MENSPLTSLPSNVEKSSTIDKDSESSRKSKKKIGKVAVEIQPKDKAARGEQATGLFERTKKTDKATSEVRKLEKAEETAAVLPELPEHASLERLDGTERHLVEREAVEQSRAGAESDDLPAEVSAEELVADRAVEDFRDKIVLEGKPTEQAAAETLDEIPDIAEAVLPELPDPKTLKSEPAETIIDTHQPNEGEVVLDPSKQEGPDDDLGTDSSRTSSASPSTPPSTNSRSNGGGGAGSNLPPHLGGNFNMYPPTPPNVTAYVAPQNQNMISIEDANYYIRRAQNDGLLVGGVLGYLIGRRRGRIKTEKKLLPIQKKLEKQANNLRQEVADRENDIRQAAIKEMRTRSPEGAQALLARPKRERVQPPEPELRRRPAPDAERLHSKKMQPESIGHVLITAQTEREIRRPVAPEITQPKVVEEADTKKLSPEKQVETMTRNELLLLCEKIAVDGATLRQIYQTHLVGERGLRRIVTEYLRGGDVKRQLRRELVEREIDFERDPILRDRARTSISSGGARGALDSLLVKAGAIPTGTEVAEQLAAQAAQTVYEESVSAKYKHRRRIADISLIGTIVVLILLVAVLLLTRY